MQRSRDAGRMAGTAVEPVHRKSDCRPAATQHPAIDASIGRQMIRIPLSAASCSPDEMKAAFNQTIWL
jgi:hypothetical protein